MIGITWRHNWNIILYLFSHSYAFILSLNQKGDERQATCANQCSREHVQEEENKIEDQAIREGKTAETSKKDEEMEEVPKQEVKWTETFSRSHILIELNLVHNLTV